MRRIFFVFLLFFINAVSASVALISEFRPENKIPILMRDGQLYVQNTLLTDVPCTMLRKNGFVITDTFKFGSAGAIDGYSHQHEYKWVYDEVNKSLSINDREGNPTNHLKATYLKDGVIFLYGTSHDYRCGRATLPLLRITGDAAKVPWSLYMDGNLISSKYLIGSNIKVGAFSITSRLNDGLPTIELDGTAFQLADGVAGSDTIRFFSNKPGVSHQFILKKIFGRYPLSVDVLLGKKFIVSYHSSYFNRFDGLKIRFAENGKVEGDPSNNFHHWKIINTANGDLLKVYDIADRDIAEYELNGDGSDGLPLLLLNLNRESSEGDLKEARSYLSQDTIKQGFIQAIKAFFLALFIIVLARKFLKQQQLVTRTEIVFLAFVILVIYLFSPYYFNDDDNYSQFTPVVNWFYSHYLQFEFPKVAPIGPGISPLVPTYAILYPLTAISYLTAKFLFLDSTFFADVFAIIHLAFGYAVLCVIGQKYKLESKYSSLVAASLVLSGPVLIFSKQWFYFSPFLVWSALSVLVYAVRNNLGQKTVVHNLLFIALMQLLSGNFPHFLVLITLQCVLFFKVKSRSVYVDVVKIFTHPRYYFYYFAMLGYVLLTFKAVGYLPRFKVNYAFIDLNQIFSINIFTGLFTNSGIGLGPEWRMRGTLFIGLYLFLFAAYIARVFVKRKLNLQHRVPQRIAALALFFLLLSAGFSSFLYGHLDYLPVVGVFQGPMKNFYIFAIFIFYALIMSGYLRRAFIAHVPLLIIVMLFANIISLEKSSAWHWTNRSYEFACNESSSISRYVDSSSRVFSLGLYRSASPYAGAGLGLNINLSCNNKLKMANFYEPFVSTETRNAYKETFGQMPASYGKIRVDYLWVTRLDGGLWWGPNYSQLMSVSGDIVYADNHGYLLKIRNIPNIWKTN